MTRKEMLTTGLFAEVSRGLGIRCEKPRSEALVLLAVFYSTSFFKLGADVVPSSRHRHSLDQDEGSWDVGTFEPRDRPIG